MNFNQKLPDKTRCYFRLLVSAYLVYLGVSILKGTLKGEAKGVILPIIAVAFIVFGVGYAIFSLRILFQILKAEKEERIPAKARSISRIRSGKQIPNRMQIPLLSRSWKTKILFRRKEELW